MATTLLDIRREIEETYPLSLRTRMSADQAESLGYASIEEAIEALSTATARLTVPAISVSVDAVIAVTQEAGDAVIRLTFALPTTVTDTAQARTYLVIFEPGSATAERVLCQGTLTINARPA